MDWSLRELRTFVTAVDAGSFTEAASQLFVSQAAVSRTIASLERAVGTQLLRRVPRGCEPTPAGHSALPLARRVLAEADALSDFLASGTATLRLGYTWGALGSHTPALLRSWVKDHPDVTLELLRHQSATAGLAEGRCDVAIFRREADDPRFDSVVVGLERRMAAFPADDERWRGRRQLRLAEFAGRKVLLNPRHGSTSPELWGALSPPPRFVDSSDVDTWLDAIVGGAAVGVTSESTAYHHPRPGVVYRPIKDGPRIPVRLVWWRGHEPRGLDLLVDAVTRRYDAGRT